MLPRDGVINLPTLQWHVTPAWAQTDIIADWEDLTWHKCHS
ncbi:hypothetical protein [Streptomyces sp. NPDC056982]